jgi:2-oxoglutarate/2-oxoacid ferredoxin oxidoreductase subunit alpha
VLVLGWGSTYGVVRATARRIRERGLPIAIAHLRYVNPLPANTGEVLHAYPKLLVPEMNSGQLLQILRAEFLVEAEGYNKVEGMPILADDIEPVILRMLGNEAGDER